MILIICQLVQNSFGKRDAKPEHRHIVSYMKSFPFTHESKIQNKSENNEKKQQKYAICLYILHFTHTQQLNWAANKPLFFTRFFFLRNFGHWLGVRWKFIYINARAWFRIGIHLSCFSFSISFGYVVLFTMCTECTVYSVLYYVVFVVCVV